MNPDKLHAQLVLKGKEKARTAAYATTTDRLRKQTRARLMVHYINQGETVGKSEQLALIHDDYTAAAELSEKAEEAAGVAAIEYQSAQAWWESWRTIEATKRAEMNIR